MAGAGKLIRRAIHTFFQDYHSFATISALAALPVSLSALLSQALFTPPSPLLRAVRSRYGSLFAAAGFPASSEFFSLVSLKLSQTTLSFLSTLPFKLTFLIFAKAAVVHTVFCSSTTRRSRGGRRRQLLLPSLRLYQYHPLLQTHVLSSFTVLSVNAVVFSLFFLVFNAAYVLGVSSSPSSNTILILSAAAAILYSVVLAHALVACNLAAIISGVEGRGGSLAIIKAFLLLRGRAATALSLALPANLGMAATEALFQHRVMKPYQTSKRLNPSAVGEAFSIAYMHSIFLVLDVISSSMFLKTCNLASLELLENRDQCEQGGGKAGSATSKCEEQP